MSDRATFESGQYTVDDVLDWYDTMATPEHKNQLKKQPRENFDEITEYEEDGMIYTIGTDDGVSVILEQKKKPNIFGIDMTDLKIGGLKVKQNLSTAADFLGDAFNPKNIAKGVNQGVVNAFGLVDSMTGGAVTKLDNYFVENFPNTLGKKFQFDPLETPGEITGGVIGQYVLTDLFLRRAFPILNRGFKGSLAADGSTVFLFSSKDEGNLMSMLGSFLPEGEDANAVAKVITENLTPDSDDSELEGRLKNVISDTGALSAVMSVIKIIKHFVKKPEAVEQIQEAQSAGAAATPKDAPTPVEVIDSSGQSIKQADQTDDVVKKKSEKPFYSNVEKAISNLNFKQQPGNQILATLNNTAGIKQSEIQDLGLDTFLKDNPNVTKEQLDDFIANKSLTTRVSSDVLEEAAKVDINYAEGKMFIPRGLAEANSFEDAKLIVSNNQALYNELVRYIESFPGKGADDITDQVITDFLGARYKMFPIDDIKAGKKTKFESYVTPGGENYKEMLITAPGTPQVFTDHHYRGEVAPGENLIAHARFNDRTIDNKKILFIEEVQSDLHQAGRKQGYVPKDANAPETLQQVEILRQQKANILEQIEKAKAERAFTRVDDASMGGATKVEVIDPSTDQIIKTYKLTGNATQKANIIGEAAVYADDWNKDNGITDAITNLTRDSDTISRQILDAKGEGKIADAPFKKNWYELTMKRLIKYAIDNGYDGIAFTTGEMQVLRYPGMQNPEGLKGFYDNTLTKVTTKFGNKYGAELEKGKLNDAEPTYYYTKADFDNDDLYVTYDAVSSSPSNPNKIFASYRIEETSIPGENRYQLVQIKDGKENIVYTQEDLSLVKDVLAEELDGFKVPQINKKIEGSEVPLLIFPQNMKDEILTEGVPIAQVEERENKQQTTAVV